MTDEPEIPELDGGTVSLWSAEGRRVLVLDSLGNDHNLGAVVRSAAFFGVRDIVLAGPGSSGLVTTSAYRVAEGGMEYVSLRSAGDAGALRRLAGPDFVILGADHRGPETLRAAVSKARPGRALALVLGNEEKGLSLEARAACSAMVRVPGTGDIESLNVAQTAAILLYELASASPAGKTALRRPRIDADF